MHSLQESIMQKRELDCVTVGVAHRTDIRGKAIADETDRGLRIAKGKTLRRIACSTLIVVAGLCFALATKSARANDDNDRHGERQDNNEKGLPAQIAALRAQVESLQSNVSALESQVSTLQTSNAALEKQLDAVQSNKALQLGPFVSVVSGASPIDGVKGPHIYFTGANIHIVSGSGSTDDKGTRLGLGNLIIGYDEDPGNFADTSPFDNLPLSPLIAGDRGGSHNLVIGAANRFTQTAFGGLVVGTANTIKGPGASVSGGAGNTADNYGGSVSGGFSNDAGSFFSSVSGGRYNKAAVFFTSVSGGDGNTAGDGHYGVAASVSGGASNVAGGDYASVSGGTGNDAFDDFTSITGGTSNTAGSDITFQGGLGASVTGGTGNHAGGRNTVVIGGQNIIDNNDNSIAPKAPYP
jgi:hypothetical protein